ncbi:hypothetical protein BH09VER1_BH09VER1_08160 [soil metagenome]
MKDGAVLALSGTGRLAARLEGDIPKVGDSLFLQGRTGKQMMGLTVTLKTASGEKRSLSIRPTVDRGDDYLSFIGWRGPWGKYYARPNPTFYKPEELAKRKSVWASLPGASGHSLGLELRPTGDSEIEVWLDGQFMQILPMDSPALRYEITLAPEASVESLRFEEVAPATRLTLPIAARAPAQSNLRLELDPNAAVPTAFAKLAGPARGIPVGGLGTFPGLVTEDLQSSFWRRHASHCLPEQAMFSVPLAVYSHANILCAVDTKEGAVPEFTLRVTRYGGSRGNAMADTIVRIPAGEKSGESNARVVGSVQSGTGVSTPLWLIKVPIKNGLIEDLLHSDTFKDNNVGTSRYLDVELLDPLANVEKADAFPPPTELTNRAWRPTVNNPRSSVTVFGITLDPSPSDLTVRANLGFQAFYLTDQPAFFATVKAFKAGHYTLQWTVADIAGTIVDSGTQGAKVDAGQEQMIAVQVKEGIGWYAARFQLSDSQKAELVDYRTSFVMLAPDTRKAGLESPFYGWWFQKNQRSDVKLEEVGPLLQRLGVRRVGLSPDMPESVTMKYGFTESTISWRDARLAMLDFRDGKATLEQALAAQEASIRSQLALWPSIDRLLVFHESGAKGAPFPSEIYGEPARDHTAASDENSPEALMIKEGAAPAAALKKADDEWRQNWPRRIEYLIAMAKMVRHKFPKLKMQYGNDGNSLGLMGELFRQKFPRESIDTISIEDLGQTFAPERGLVGGLQSAWFLRETARQMGYGDIPITACTEWIGRMTERLGLQKQAEWKVRDGLLALAYGFDTISIAGINDAGSGYYFSGWANGGLCYRYPTMAPKPAYAAIATLTQVLDHAKFQRMVPTGSSVLYAMEFRHGEAWIYALWTPRGTRETSWEFAQSESRILTDLYGRTTELEGKVGKLKASPAPQYLTSKTQIVSFKAGGAAFPADQAPAKTAQVIPLESISEVSIVSDKGPEKSRKAHPELLPHLREGDFAIREVVDDQMGRCLEVELKPTRDLLWAMEHEYVILQLKMPVATSSKNAGLWIKGNGSWGEVDLRTASSGSPWLTNNDLSLRWPGDATLNFDGWNFICYPSSGNAKNSPNQVTGIMLTMPRQTICGPEMAPVENLKIRLKSIVLF